MLLLMLAIAQKIRYLDVEPSKFRPLDVAELQISFVGVSVKNNRYKIIAVLRAITLLDTQLSNVSEYIY